MRVVLTGGGTGGHIYPALAIGKQLERETPDTEVLYIGTANGLESRIVPDAGFAFESIEIAGFRRKLSLDNVKTVMKFIRGVRRSKQLLRQFKPDAVIGTGGYVCGPVVYAAAKLGIPTLIHEQNVIPGLTNKFLSRYADVVAISFEESASYFTSHSNVIHTGNPCATNVLRANRANGYAALGIKPDTRIVLIVGGSRGAKALNDAMTAMIPMLDALPDVHFVFVTGESYYEQTVKKVGSATALGGRLHILPYLHNMPEVLAATSLIVSRSGASSLAEITALGVPAILIPSPNVTNNHQEPNARSLENAGAAVMLLEKELTGATLMAHISSIMNDQGKLEAMGAAALKLGMPKAADRIAAALRTIAERS
jgi:UDP-N-acetylglucosamine--N-acetylmuramyl-(pentapeptide) pyrophosphoryl-undecaprenol N-acetylglucosamine transferase